MTSRIVVAGLALIWLVCACDGSASSSSGDTSSSSSSSQGEKREVTLSGTSGHAELAGDRIDLREGMVYVNDLSFGPIPPGAVIRYSVTSARRELRVAGELRTGSR